MSEDIVNQQTVQLEDLQIQSSAYVSSQSLLSTSMPSSPVASASNVVSKKSSKSRLTGEEDDNSHYQGTMERFFQSEVRPVFFGKLEIMW